MEFCEKENLCEKAQVDGELLKQKLEEIGSPKIREIRGIGLMLAINLKIPAKEIVEKLQEEGVLVLQTGAKTIRLLPPLVISKEEIGEIAEKLEKVLRN